MLKKKSFALYIVFNIELSSYFRNLCYNERVLNYNRRLCNLMKAILLSVSRTW